MDPLTLSLLVGGGASLIGGGINALSANAASKRQVEAADRAKEAVTSSYNTATGYQQPYLQAGGQGLNQLLTGNYDVNAPGAYQSQEQQPGWQAPQFNFQQDPGQKFAMQQGLGAVMGSAAGRGAGLSGGTLKALQQYGTGLAGQQYGDAFNRYMQGRQQGFGEYQTGLGQYNLNRQFGAGQQQQAYENLNQQALQRYGRAAGLAGMGQQAAGTLGQMATEYGGNLAGIYGQRGNAQAAGAMGIGQGIGGGISNIGQMAMLAGMMGGGGGTPQSRAQSAYNATPYGRAANQIGL